MTIRPLYDRIVVKRMEEKQQMQGGLHIPDSAQEKPQEVNAALVKWLATSVARVWPRPS